MCKRCRNCGHCPDCGHPLPIPQPYIWPNPGYPAGPRWEVPSSPTITY